MPTAVLFPGQASQTPGMRADVYDHRPDLLELVCELVGEDPFPRADESTRYAQPAIFCASLAGWDSLRNGVDAVAGHSLGELSALAAAGAIDEADALRLVVLRGRLMSETADGTMLAALGGSADDVEAIALRNGVTVANDNAPGQLVLSGTRKAIAASAEDLRAAGIRALELNVAGAFHSPLMTTAVPRWSAAVGSTPVHEPHIPVWSSVTAQPITDVRATLVRALTRPVKWRQTILAMHESGIDSFQEAGPGKTLTKMLKRTLPKELAGAA
jgi:[acyl-carrier-protein] S-malonyltransferase